MGSGASVEHPEWREYQEMTKRSLEIDDMLVKSFRDEAKVIKILILGAAECGKSTILKQMRILHMNGFTEDDHVNFKRLIYFNMVESISQLVAGMEKLGVPFRDSSNGSCWKLVEKFYEFLRGATFMTSLDPNVAEAILSIWQDANVQKCYARRQEFYLYDSAKYYLDQTEVIARSGYVPSVDDILRSRFQTIGCVQVDFVYRKERFRMIDVGGHRSQRKKWIHFFDNVTAILFIASAAEYDQLLVEDEKTNRLHESIRLYKSIVNNPIFSKTAVMLFLNKMDLFEEKLTTRKIPFSVCFPKFTGTTAEECKEKLKNEFLKRSPPTKEVYVYFTNATDTRNIDRVFDAAAQIILSKNLTATGLQI